MKRNPGAQRLRVLLFGPVAAALLLGVALFTALHNRPAARPFQAPAKPELWYWHNSFLISDQAVQQSKALIARAAGYGYTGVAFWDNSFNYLSTASWDPANVRRLHDVLQYAAGCGLKVMVLGAPFGYSNVALIPDGNLAEGQRVGGTRFKVDASGTRLNLVNSLAPLENAGFEKGKTGWFDTGDAGLGVSTDVSHGGRQAGLVVDAPGNARFRQRVSLTPWRQYHLSLWVKSRGFHGPAVVEVIDWWHRSQSAFYTEIPVDGTREWTRLDFTFNSRDTGWAYLYFGVWGRSSGVLWFDDIGLEETGPVYVVRRAGAPLKLYDPERPKFAYREGIDYDRVFDPALSPPHAAFRDNYHAPVQIGLPAGTTLKPGETVAMDYYAAFPIPKDNQMGMCLSEPGVFRWLEGNARKISAILPPRSDLLLSYDEMRQANSCALCRTKHMTAGELLAWNAEKTVKLYERELPGTELYTWSDMFDPYHNAHNHYFYVEGDVAGSWKGLPAEVGVLNWNHPYLPQSLRWFAGLNRRQPVAHKQIIASYYDSGDGNSSATDLRRAGGIPGLQGIMYVSWRNDYSQLETFAKSAKNAWGAYLKSLDSGGA